MSNAVSQPLTAPAMGETFDEVVLPHLDAAYRLACWLMRNEHDAEDVVQEASLRALRYFRTFHGGNARAWFLRMCATPVLACAAMALTRRPTRSTKSNTAPIARDPIRKRSCSTRMTPR